MSAKRKIVSESRGFKGVWIPAKYWLDENLSAMEMLMLVEIDSLDQDQGCFASNSHFADFFGLTPGRCSQLIKSLQSKGYIEIEYQKEGKLIKRRVIRVVNKLNTPVNKLKGGSKFSKGGYLENAEGSNTSRVIQDSNTDSSLPSRSEGHPRRGKGEIFNIFQDPIIKEIREMDGDYHDDIWKFYQSYLKTHPNGGSEEERREFIKTVANVYLSPARLQQIEEEEEAKKK